MTTASDPRPLCVGCGQPAMDGKRTCGQLACGPSTGNDQTIEEQLEAIARSAGVDPEAMWTMSVAEFGVRVALGRQKPGANQDELVDAMALVDKMRGSHAS